MEYPDKLFTLFNIWINIFLFFFKIDMDIKNYYLKKSIILWILAQYLRKYLYKSDSYAPIGIKCINILDIFWDNSNKLIMN